MVYQITEKELKEILIVLQANPNAELDIKPMNDGAPFLSCAFFYPDKQRDIGSWELSAVGY